MNWEKIGVSEGFEWNYINMIKSDNSPNSTDISIFKKQIFLKALNNNISTNRGNKKVYKINNVLGIVVLSKIIFQFWYTLIFATIF